jgi:hypothetical protein
MVLAYKTKVALMGRVLASKWELESHGGDAGDEEPFPVPIDPKEDKLDAAGLYMQDVDNWDETTLVNRDGNDMKFKDSNNPTGYTLTQLATGSPTVDLAWRRHFLMMGA